MRLTLAERTQNIDIEHLAQLEAQSREHSARTILSLQNHFESIRSEVLARYRPKLGPLTVDQEEAVKALTRSLADNIADLPISEIRRQVVAEKVHEQNTETSTIRAVRRIFRLSEADAEKYQ